MRLLFLVLSLFVSACATVTPSPRPNVSPFDGLDALGKSYVVPALEPEEILRLGREAETVMLEAMRDEPPARPITHALEEISTNRPSARKDLYTLLTQRQASRLATAEEQILFGELLRLAFVRLSFPSCHDQLVMSHIRSLETADTSSGGVLSEWARMRADAYLRWQHHLGCD